MFIDRFIPNLPGAAGTYVDGRMLSGDHAPMWQRAGVPTEHVCVQCSARIANGEDCAPRGMVRVAIDCNGKSPAVIAAIIGAQTVPAVGAYDGTMSPACVATIPAARILSAHAALRAQLPGFGCFAVLSNPEAA